MNLKTLIHTWDIVSTAIYLQVNKRKEYSMAVHRLEQ